MPWPIPQPGDIAGRAAAIFEQALPGIDARNANTVATTICRVVEMAMQDLYYYQGNLAMELMPDTAQDNLPRFGYIWDVPQTQASAANGNVIVSGAAGAPIPAETVFVFSGSSVTYSNPAAITVPAGETSVSVAVVASLAGSAGNLAAATQLTIASPVAGLTSQVALVDAAGITGGADIESTSAWRGEIITQIQEEPSGGDAADYVKWAKAALPDVALAACPAGASGGGVVSVVIAMTGLVAPSSGQIASVLAYIDTLRPVTASVSVYGAVLNALNITLHLNPDTPAIRAAAQAALALSFLQDATIGGTTEFSRLDAAVSSSDGEYAHDMTVAGAQADVAAASLFALNILGAVTFT